MPTDLSADGIRAFHLVQVSGQNCPDPVASFDQTPFSKSVQGQLKSAGFKHPTAIQSQGWPVVCAGRDCIAVAKTGSGKTVAYLLPAIMHIQKINSMNNSMTPSVLILAPTRELAIQIEVEARKFTQTGVRAVCVYGGVPKGPQVDKRNIPPIIYY